MKIESHDSRYFKVNGLLYRKKDYVATYENVSVNESSNEFVTPGNRVVVVIKEKYTGDIILSCEVEKITNASNVAYTTLTSLITDLKTILDDGISVSQGPTGPAGPAGSQGPQGATGPTGATGVQGPAGPVGPAGLNWRSTWVSGTSYVKDDAVGYNGASYFCILAVSGTSNPATDTSHWALLASQGAVGPAGPTGATGATGPTGAVGPTGPTGPTGATGPVGVASQTLQQTINLGNTVNDGSYITTISTTEISNQKISAAVTSTFSYEGLAFSKNGFISRLYPADTLTANTIIRTPNTSGTIALLSDIPAATIPTLTQVVGAGNTITSGTITSTLNHNGVSVVDGVYSSNGYPGAIQYSNTARTNLVSYQGSSLFNSANGITTGYGHRNLYIGDGTNVQTLAFPSTITGGTKTITLPNATGTVALVSYKVYVALLEFVNGSTITATVLQNTIGDGSADGVNDIAWSYNAGAQPKATMSSGSPFTSGKTICVNSMYMQGDIAYSLAGYRISSTQVRFYSSQISNNTSSLAFVPNVYVEIRVYN